MCCPFVSKSTERISIMGYHWLIDKTNKKDWNVIISNAFENINSQGCVLLGHAIEASYGSGSKRVRGFNLIVCAYGHKQVLEFGNEFIIEFEKTRDGYERNTYTIKTPVSKFPNSKAIGEWNFGIDDEGREVYIEPRRVGIVARPRSSAFD